MAARRGGHRDRPASMLFYVLRRMVAAVVLLLLVTLAAFAIFFLVPRAAGASAEDLASRYTGKTASAEQTAETAERLGFNDPFLVQYGRFVKGIVAGDTYDTGPTTVECPAPCVGYSYLTQNPVLPDLLSRLPVTISLAVGAAVLWLVFGVATGVASALRRGSVLDRASMGIALAGVSLPIFFTGLLLLSIFSYGLGITAPGGSWTPFTENPAAWAYALLLPWIALAFQYAALYARLTRAGMLETMNEDFVRTARAKGLGERPVIFKHALRATLTPILTIFGLDLGLLLGGAVITETTFSLPGIGSFAVQAIKTNDLPQLLGVTLVAAFFIVVANLVVDVLYAVVDPRVRVS